MESKERNLLSLKAEFHDKGKAARGYKNIIRMVNDNEDMKIGKLLRFHSPKAVYGEELVQRFEIDALIEYYNLILIGVFSGYISGDLNEDITEEIAVVLDQQSVKRYYQEYYPYKMASYTLRFVNENRHYEFQGNATTITAFNEFISLNRILKRDRDLETFIGMLDHVWYDNKTIKSVNKILSSAEKLRKAIIAKSKSRDQSAVLGFIKYTTFLSELKELIIAAQGYPLLQSSFWLFHGYYLDRMNSQMRLILDEAFDNLETTLSDPEIYSNMFDDHNQIASSFELTETQLREFAGVTIQQSREDVDFVLNPDWARPLREYFENTQLN